MTPDIDIIIFIAFLIINLVVGLAYGKEVKTISDYSLGGRNFSTAALVSTIVATFVTGSAFFVTLSKTYSDGLPYVIASSCMSLGFFLTAFFIIPRMGEFMGALSVGEVMGTLYGKHVRLITAISAIIWNVGGIAVQFKVFGTLFNYFVGIPSTYAIILASTIVILYSTFGGIRAVTYTDVIQFFTFGFVLPTIAVIIWNHFKSLGFTVEEAIENPLFSFEGLSHLEGYKLIDFILLALYFLFPAIGPTHFQRISMASSISQARKAWLVSSILLVVIKLIIAWIPFLVLTIKPNLEPNQVTSYLIDNYTNLPLIKGLLIIGVSAMAMSSADSFINGSAVLFGYDVKEVLNIKVNDLVLSRLFSFVLGLFAIYLALSTNDLLAMVMSAASFYLPIVGIPLLLAVFGFRTTEKSVLIAMAAGFTTVVSWEVLDIKLNCIIFAMLVNMIVLFGFHYIFKQAGGWVGIKDYSYLEKSKKENNRMISALVRN
ncbi:MAG TPA: sodium:solute symporter family protein, partial [Candidatus Megaira endosymbiont of Stentor roeselii]|nr:sodium:solute symporter family protein [Candidatus Megaera endosymbiont of Stentor roeselii]